MKKILGISLVSVLAAIPMMADASIVSGSPYATVTGEDNIAAATAENEAPYGLAEYHSTDVNMATAGYVKGAYNASMKAINKVAADAQTAANTAEQNAKNYAAGLGSSYATAAQGTLASTAVQSAGTGLSLSNKTISLSEATQTSLGLANTALQADGLAGKTLNINAASLKVNDQDVLTAASIEGKANASDVYTKDEADAAFATAAQGALASTAVQSAGTGLAKDGTTISLSEATQTALTKAGTALQANSELNGANLAAGSVAASALDNDVQAALTKAGTALQQADLTGYATEADVRTVISNSTVKVMTEWGAADPTPVEVKITAPAN